jgi:PAS domain S-box-containing protein
MKNRFFKPGFIFPDRGKTTIQPPIQLASNGTPFSISANNKDEQYKAIIENSGNAFFLSDADGLILESNPATSVLFGYKMEELLLLKTWQLIDYTGAALSAASPQQEDNAFTTTTATGIKKDGLRFPVEISDAFFIDTNGAAKYSSMVSDITVRKKAEADLQLSNERYDWVVRATKFLIWDWDLLTDEIYRSCCNLKDVYGHHSNQYILKISDWTEHIHPEDKDKIKARLNHYIHTAAEKDFDLEYRFRMEDGNYVFIQDKGYIIRNSGGKAIRIIGAAENITSRKKSAMAVEESEMRYKMFVQQSTEGIWRIELNEPMCVNLPVQTMIKHCLKNAFIAECNDTFAKAYGFKNAAEIINCPLSMILPDHNSLNMNYLLKFFKNGFKVRDEISYEVDKDGNQLIFINNMVGVIEGDFIKRAWGIQRDITNQKIAERNLAERENHLKAIVDTAPECIKLLSKEGIILEMNQSGLQMIGAKKADQVLGKNAMLLILPEYHEAFKKALTDVFKGKPGQLIFKISGLDKKQLFMESHIVPLRNAEGNIISALSVTRDVTESKHAQEMLEASEKRYRYLFNNNPATIIIWDIDTLEILETNDTATELFGYSKNEFSALNMISLFDGESESGFSEFIKNTKDNKIDKTGCICRHITRQGTSIVMEFTCHFITYQGSNAVLAIGNNITEKVLLENSLNEERQLRHQQITEAVIRGQEKERTELGQELHDNINQILASTKLYIECAIRDEIPRLDLMLESKSLVERAMSEIRNLSKSLLPPALGETGLKQALLELVDSINEVNDIVIMLDWKVADENIFCKNLKLTIFRITQEQLNNVLKHANAKQAFIRIEEASIYIEMSIKDDGMGFDTSVRKNGVGLRNIASRAEVNNGKYSIISKPGEGCELIVRFPAYKL